MPSPIGSGEPPGPGSAELVVTPPCEVISVDQCPAGQVQEDVLEGGAAYEDRHRLQAALMHLGGDLVAVVAVDEQPVGQGLDALAQVGDLLGDDLVPVVLVGQPEPEL